MSEARNLSGLKPGEKAVVQKVLTRGSMGRRLLDIGLIEDTLVECLGRSPAGDPSAFLIRGAVIALRAEDSAKILLAPI